MHSKENGIKICEVDMWAQVLSKKKNNKHLEKQDTLVTFTTYGRAGNAVSDIDK